jgi:hypothetical protein
MSEITAALATGKEVIAHTDQLTVPGFRGSGYVITDPVTGEGVYKISGGKNGAFFAFGFAYGGAIGLTFGVLGLAFTGPAPYPAHFIIPWAIALALELASAAIIWVSYGALYGEEAQKCFSLGLAAGLIAGGVTVAVLAAAAGFAVAAASGLFDSLLDTFSLVERGEEVKKCIH